jgi:hypothetical protein
MVCICGSLRKSDPPISAVPPPISAVPPERLRLGGAMRHAASASSTAWAASRRTALLQRTLTLPALI